MVYHGVWIYISQLWWRYYGMCWFFGLHKNKEDAIKEALERVIKGYVDCDLLPETFNYNGDYPITEESKKQKY